MATNDLLEAEARERRRVAIAAGLAAIFLIAAAVSGILVQQGSPDNLPGSLLYRNTQKFGVLFSAVTSGLGSIAIAYVLDFLFRVARARSEAAVPSWVRPLPWIGGIGLAILVVVSQAVLVTKVSHFATSGTQTYQEARDLLQAADYRTLSYLTIVPQLALAFGLVMISLGAMRVGLLTRFLGYLGMISAALFVLPLVPVPVVQIYWLAMLALLLWPGFSNARTPPAWTSGRAEPWPSAAEARDQRVRAAEARRGGGGGGGGNGARGRGGTAVAEPVQDGEVVEAEPATDAESASARRKRKKRR
jgi:hypothetical protein